MRTLHEIIEAVKSNQDATVEEMTYAICAMSALSAFDTKSLMNWNKAEKEGRKPFMIYSGEYNFKEHHRRWHEALNISPKKYVGWENDPANPNYQEFRKFALRLVDKVSK